jgi:hypothetical protein
MHSDPDVERRLIDRSSSLSGRKRGRLKSLTTRWPVYYEQ